MSQPAARNTAPRAWRAFGAVGAIAGLVLLGACASDPDLPTPAYVPPSPPTQPAIAGGAYALAKLAKLVGPLQVSPVRPSAHGPGSYVVCLKEANPPPDKPQRYYALFFDNDANKGARLAVMLDGCESQPFSPLPPAPPDHPAGPAKPSVPGIPRGVGRSG